MTATVNRVMTGVQDTVEEEFQAYMDEETIDETTPQLYGSRGLRSIVDIMADLKEPLPEKFISKREGRAGKMLDYIEWHVAERAFDKYAPGWSMEVENIAMSDGHVAVSVRVYIPCLECNPAEHGLPGFFRASTGGDYEHMDEKKRAVGFDPLLDAERQSMKRAMAQWGFGRYLYE